MQHFTFVTHMDASRRKAVLLCKMWGAFPINLPIFHIFEGVKSVWTSAESIELWHAGSLEFGAFLKPIEIPLRLLGLIPLAAQPETTVLPVHGNIAVPSTKNTAKKFTNKYWNRLKLNTTFSVFCINCIGSIIYALATLRQNCVFSHFFVTFLGKNHKKLTKN